VEYTSIKKENFMKKKLSIALLPIVLLFFASGCISPEEDKTKPDKPEETDFLENVDLTGSVSGGGASTKKSSELIDSEIVKPDGYGVKTEAGGLPSITERTPDPQLQKINPFYKGLAPAAKEVEIPITMNFDAAPVTNVIRAFSVFLKFDYLIDPQVTGNISISVNNSKMSTTEVWEMFEQILWLAGAYCSPDGDVLHILPFSKMPQERKILVDHSPQSNVEVMLFSIKNAASKDVLEKLKPFLTPGSTAMDIPHQNSILLIETPANSEKIKNFVALLDRKNKANWPQIVVPCVNVSSARIKNELLSIMPILGFPVTADNLQAGEPGAIQVTSIDRMQAILATAANIEALNELKKWVEILDKSDVGEQERVFIYKVLNGKADELLSAISVIFPTEGTTLSVTNASSGASTAASTSSTDSGSNFSTTTPSASGTSSATTAATSSIKPSASAANQKDGPASVFDVPVKVFADAVNNRLVIRTTPRTYAMMRAILERLDTVAAQVLLQIMVSEVTLTKDTEFGIEFSTSAKKGAYSALFGSNFADLVPAAEDQYGARYWVSRRSDPDNKFAYLRALAGDGKIKVLSAPQIVVKSNSEAKIAVGDSVPIVTSENTDTASGTVINRSIEYQDTGIILVITPRVTEGGLITMQIEQTVSEAFRNSTSDIDSPIIQERIIKTALSIRDGGTIIVGGLIRERTIDSNSSYPFIQEIPLLRRLLGTNNISSTRTEMLVLITGRVISEHSRLDDITKRYKQAIKALNDLEGKDESEYQK
jgi:general secretion pathway protein D